MKIQRLNYIALKSKIIFNNSATKCYYSSFVGNIRFSSEEMDEFKNAVGKILKEANLKSQKISISYLSEKIGVSRGIISDIINSDDEYKKLYEQVKKTDFKKQKTPKEVKNEQEKIANLLISAKQENKNISTREIARELGISQTTVRKRINDSNYLILLYEGVKNPILKPTIETSFNKEKEIEEILLQCVKSNQKTTVQDVIKQANITITTFYNILSRNAKINSLWQIVKNKEYHRYQDGELQILDNYIHKFLVDKKEAHQTATLLEIAQYFGVSKGLIYTRIKNNPSLTYQWNLVKTKSLTEFDEDTKKDQTKEIIRILKDIEKKGLKITRKEIADLSGLSLGTVQNRIENSYSAKRLWNKVKSQKR